MRDAYKTCYENNVSPINGMDMWPTLDVEEMLPPQYKKGPDRPKKLRFREQDESGSRMRRLGVAYRCTKCDKLGHNSRKCKSNEQDPNALKRKRKTPRSKPFTSAPENSTTPTVENVAPNNAVEPENDPELDALLDEMMNEFEEQQSQVYNPTQTGPVATHNAPVAEPIATQTAPKPVPIVEPIATQAAPKLVPGPSPKLAPRPDKKKSAQIVRRKRCSESLKEVGNAKRIGGPGSTPDDPLVFDDEPTINTSNKKKSKWEDISRRMTQ